MKSINWERIGPKFRQMREAVGLSKRELSFRSSVAEKTIYSLEMGKPIRPTKLAQLCQAAGISFEDLTGRPTPRAAIAAPLQSGTAGAADAPAGLFPDGWLCSDCGILHPPAWRCCPFSCRPRAACEICARRREHPAAPSSQDPPLPVQTGSKEAGSGGAQPPVTNSTEPVPARTPGGVKR